MEKKRYTVHITRRCNLKCEYCYEKIKDLDVEWDTIKENIDYIFSNVSSNTLLEIEFLGGEPFIVADKIDKSCNYIKENYKEYKVSYLLSTNGTIYNDKIENMILKNSINVFFSIDGMKFTHDLKRLNKQNKPTYDIAINNLKKLLLANPRLVHVHATYCKQTIGYLYEGVINLINEGVRHIDIGIVSTDLDNQFESIYLNSHRRLFYDVLIENKDIKLTPFMNDCRNEQDILNNMKIQKTKIKGYYLDEYTNVQSIDELSSLGRTYNLKFKINKLYIDCMEELKNGK